MSEESQIDAIMDSLERRFNEIDREAEQKKQALRDMAAISNEEIQREKAVLVQINSKIRKVILDLALALEAHIPMNHICERITLELGDVISPAFIQRILPEKYMTWRSR